MLKSAECPPRQYLSLTMASGASSSAATAGSCLHKRVSADNAGGAASSCLHKRVSSRELSGTTKFKKTSAHQLFSHFQLAVEHDTHDPVRGTPQTSEPINVLASWRHPHMHMSALRRAAPSALPTTPASWQRSLLSVTPLSLSAPPGRKLRSCSSLSCGSAPRSSRSSRRATSSSPSRSPACVPSSAGREGSPS